MDKVFEDFLFEAIPERIRRRQVREILKEKVDEYSKNESDIFRLWDVQDKLRNIDRIFNGDYN